MNFTEFAAKTLVLKPAGVAVPEGRLCASPAEAREALAMMDCPGEIVVADNGSTDGSQAIATAAGG